MKFDEEDLLDLINCPLNGPAKDQKERVLSKNDLLPNEIYREQDIISTLLLPDVQPHYLSSHGTPRSLKEERVICGVQCYSVIGTSQGTGRVDTIHSLLYFDNTRTSLTQSEERNRYKNMELTLKNPFFDDDFEDSSEEEDDEDGDIEFINFELEETEKSAIEKKCQVESDSDSISEASDIPLGQQDEESLESLIDNPVGPLSAGFLVPSIEPCSQSHSGSTNNLLDTEIIEIKTPEEDQRTLDDEKFNKKNIVFQINSAFNEIEIEKMSQVHEPLVYSDIQSSFDNISIQSLVVDKTSRKKRNRFKSLKTFFKLVFACTSPVKS